MDITGYFSQAIKIGASDVHLVAGSKPALRVGGELELIAAEPLDPKLLEQAIFAMLSEEQRNTFQKEKELDFAAVVGGGRFRINIHQQEGEIGLAARIVPDRIPSPKEIDFNETLYQLSHVNQGLILVTGPSGSGKSTTLAVLLDLINKERRSHIVTIEDPIEFIFAEQNSIIEQRELGRDTKSFHEALKRALRQDPNVIMVGEMRDLETISATITAAETGHLVISTLHTNSAAETIERIVDMYPTNQHEKVQGQLASVLRAVVSQQLIPRDGGGRVVAREVLINTPGIANLIREGKIAHIPSAIQTGGGSGMVTMDGYLKQLFTQGVISQQVYENRVGTDESKSTYY